jgi:hypothetical protein
MMSPNSSQLSPLNFINCICSIGLLYVRLTLMATRLCVAAEFRDVPIASNICVTAPDQA